MNNVEFRGHWWIPNNPSNKVAGFLIFSQEKGGKLELIGGFKAPFENAFENYSIILGVTTDGKLITLHDCSVTYHHSTTEMTQKTDLDVRFIFMGIHIPESEALRFNKAQAKFTYLYDWVGISGIAVDQLKQEHMVQFTYTIPEDISISIPNGKIELTFGADVKSNYDIANLNEKTSIFIELNEEMNFNEISRNFLFPLQSLISLGTTKSNFIEEFQLIHKEFPTNLISVYYAQPFYKSKAKDYLLRPDMFFTLSDIYEDLETRINNWIALSQQIDSVLHLLNRARISTDMFLELRFLTIAQAIETYHRRRQENEILPIEEHQARVKEILDAVSEENSAWLEKILIHTNEPRLSHRLKALLIEYKAVLNPIIDNLQDSNNRRERFYGAVVRTRNYYTHFDKNGESGALKGEKLLWATEKLFVLLQSCLVNELGFSPEQIAELFAQNKYYNHLKLN